MKKLLHLSIITVLAGSVTLSLPVYADKKKTEEPAKEVAKETKPESDLQGFSVTHTIGGKAQPTAKVDSDPWALWGALKQDLIAQLAKGKPLEMTTEIKPIFSSELAKTLKGLPPITVKTNVGADGQGVSDVSVPAYKYEGTKKGEKGVIDWQGLTGQVKFPEDFSTMSQAFELAGATIDIEDTFKATLAKTTFSADVDADLYPTKLNFNLPSLEGGDKDVQFVFNKILVDFTGRKGTSGLELGKGSFSIADVNVDNKAEESQFKLNNLSVKFDTQEEKDVANYTLNLSLDKFFASQEEIDLSFLSNIELRKFDIAALLEIQKTASEMRKQQMAGKMDESMMGMAMMGSLMQALPKLMAKSPEIAMTKLNLKTEEGQLDGGFSISLDGSKPLKMDDSVAMLNALSGQADFVIDKGLIEQLMWMQMGSGEEMTEEQEKQMQTMIDQQIEDVVKQGLLVPTGEQFKLNATLKAGKLMVNGKEMPLPM